jgi:hypothetical protein
VTAAEVVPAVVPEARPPSYLRTADVPISPGPPSLTGG